MYFIQHCFICRPSDSTVSEDAGIEPNTVATSALAVRRSSYSGTSHPHSATSHPHLATSHPHSACISPTLGCISSTLGYISSTLGDISSTLGDISSTLGYISSTLRIHAKHKLIGALRCRLSQFLTGLQSMVHKMER
jgi:hypothetical protein